MRAFFGILFIAAIVIGWVKNAIKLWHCDFAAPYLAEIVHGLGLVPVIGMITGWLDVGR